MNICSPLDVCEGGTPGRRGPARAVVPEMLVEKVNGPASGAWALAAAELLLEPSCLVCSATAWNSWKCFARHKPTPRKAPDAADGARRASPVGPTVRAGRRRPAVPWQSPPRLSPACPHREHRSAAATFLFPAGPRAQIPVGTVSRVPGGVPSQLGCWARSSSRFRLGGSGPDPWR